MRVKSKPRGGIYCWTRFDACSLPFLQSHWGWTIEIWHQKLSARPAVGGGVTVGLAGIGSGVFKPALTTIELGTMDFGWVGATDRIPAQGLEGEDEGLAGDATPGPAALSSGCCLGF